MKRKYFRESLAMSGRLSLIALFALACGNVSAAWTICQIGKDAITFTAVGWDSETGAAKATDTLGQSHNGRVVAIRKHDSGQKVNIDIDYRTDILGSRPTEFMIFPAGANEMRVIGVGYRIVDGKRLLDLSWGNHAATCMRL